MGVAPQESVRFQLNVEVRDLRPRLRKGYVVFYTSKEDNVFWKEVGRTEEGLCGRDFRWVRGCLIEYHPNEIALVKTKLYAVGKKGEPDLVSYVSCTLPQVVLARGKKLLLPLRTKQRSSTGELVIRAEEIREKDSCEVQFTVEAYSLRKGKFPYFEISRELKDGTGWYPVIRSESHRGYSSGCCTFKRTVTTSTILANSDNHRRLRIEFFDSKVGLGKDYTGGHCIFTLSDVLRAKRAGERYELPLTKLRSRSQQESSAGSCAILDLEMEDDLSFQEVMEAGCMMNTMFAVDFSSTNGDLRDPSCPHYISMYGPNEYESVLKEVGCLLASYDTYGAFAAWGFSARLGSDPSRVSQCFPLNGSESDPSCGGIDGVIAAYKNRVCEVMADKPCLLAPVLERAVQYCHQIDRGTTGSRPGDVLSNGDANTKMPTSRAENVHNILLVLTDGDFDDFHSVQNILSEAAFLSLSIVLVSVGNAECSKLSKLGSASTARVDGEGVKPARKVQYIPFRRYRGKPAKLASEVFREIPSHIGACVKSKGTQDCDQLQTAEVSKTREQGTTDKHPTKMPRPVSTSVISEDISPGSLASPSTDYESGPLDAQVSGRRHRRSAPGLSLFEKGGHMESTVNLDEVPISFVRPLFPLPLQSTFESSASLVSRDSCTSKQRPMSAILEGEEKVSSVGSVEPSSWPEARRYLSCGYNPSRGDVGCQQEREQVGKPYSNWQQDFDVNGGCHSACYSRRRPARGALYESLRESHSQGQYSEDPEKRRSKQMYDPLDHTLQASLSGMSDGIDLTDVELHPDHIRCAQQQICHSLSAQGQSLSAYPTAPPPPMAPMVASLRPSRGRRMQENVGW